MGQSIDADAGARSLVGHDAQPSVQRAPSGSALTRASTPSGSERHCPVVGLSPSVANGHDEPDGRDQGVAGNDHLWQVQQHEGAQDDKREDV